MATYRQILTQPQAPATADVSNLARTIATTNASDAQATANLLKIAGGTMWDAYVGKQQADLEKGLQEQVNTFQQELNDVKTADMANKASVERMRTEVQGARKDYYGASILSGVDEETARNRAMQVGGTQESSVLAEYRSAQEKIMAARDSMPQRQHEFMQRSETILKEYIAKLPGLANNFRQIAEEVTGKRGLDLYSVNRLYEDVNFIERQNQESQKKQQEMQAKMMTAYINDRKSGGISETQAIAEYSRLDNNSRMELANLAVTKANAKANADAALKLGGEQLQNYVTYKTTQFNASVMEAQGSVFAQLSSKFNISKTQIQTGSIPDHVKANPEYVRIMDEAGGKILTLLEEEYKSGLADIRKQLESNVIDSSAARTATKDLDAWYAEKQKFYTENKNSPLLAFAGNEDTTKTAQQRLTLINTYAQTFQIPPDIVMELMSMDEKTFSTAATRYPMAKQQLMYLRELSSAALRGVGNDEWIGLLKKVDTYKTNGITEIPKTNQDASAALINVNQNASDLNTKVQTNQPIVANDIFNLAASGMASPANAETLFKKSDKTIDIALSKLSPEDKQSLIANTNQKANSFIYGVKGFGDDAKTKLTQYINAPVVPQLRDVANPPTFVFKDATGNSALSMTKEITMKEGITDPVKINMFNTYKKTGLMGDDLNKRLAHIDSVLRIQSKTTGTPLADLRKNFIMTFNQAGMPSDVATRSFVEAANAPVTTAPKQEPVKTNTTAPVRGNDILNSLKALQGG